MGESKEERKKRGRKKETKEGRKGAKKERETSKITVSFASYMVELSVIKGVVMTALNGLGCTGP